MPDDIKTRLVAVTNPMEKLLNYLSNMNRGLRHEVDMLKAENKFLKEQRDLVFERKTTVVERGVIYGRL